jgi:hypothetical protein
MIYINRDNRAHVIDVSSSKNMVEKHGYHPIPSSTVYRNAQNQDDAICIVYQGRVMPQGHVQDKQSLEHLNWEIYLTSLLDGKMDVDSELSRLLHALMRYAIPVGVMVLLMFVGLSMVMSGGA